VHPVEALAADAAWSTRIARHASRSGPSERSVTCGATHTTAFAIKNENQCGIRLLECAASLLPVLLAVAREKHSRNTKTFKKPLEYLAFCASCFSATGGEIRVKRPVNERFPDCHWEPVR
jgi:adenosyl cobinamide kinase/adenosyl cobinamide phosphate guanylyltransferase